VSKVLKENTKYPVRSCWSESVRNLERAMSKSQFQRVKA
jgi:hypothetical protein